MSKRTSTKPTVDSKGNSLYLRVVEDRDSGYFHLRARVCTRAYESGSWQPVGVDDDYDDGLLWSHLRISCQGDSNSRTKPEAPVYGFDVIYSEMYGLDLRRVRRMHKTLEKIAKGLERLSDARGYARSYGEYLGRVAEVLGCAGMAFERNARQQASNGERCDWTTVGDGVNRANHAIYAWQQELVEAQAARAPRQLQAAGEGGVVVDGELAS